MEWARALMTKARPLERICFIYMLKDRDFSGADALVAIALHDVM
jgi:hypothetical protein